jgi:hypothetical protein
MVVEEALMAYLKTSISSLVSNRVHYLKLPQNPKLPAITMQKIDSNKIGGFSADIGAMTRIQITAWANTYAECSAIQEAVRAATQNYFNQTMGTGGVPVKNIELDEGPDLYDDEITRIGKITDLLIYHTEA